MINWKDPEVIAYDFFLYGQIAVFLLGFYGKHFFSTWNVEWELIMRKRAFRIVHIPYLLARYITLSALLFFVISGHVKLKIACDLVYRTFSVHRASPPFLRSETAPDTSLLSPLAPSLLQDDNVPDAQDAHTAIPPWNRSARPALPVMTYAPARAQHYITEAIWTVRARWDPASHGCAVVTWHSTFLGIQYLYTSLYDAAILLATLWAVRRVHDGRRWGLGDALRMQGLCYLVVTCIANVPVAVLAFLDLNTAMDVLLSMLAMTISVVASSLTMLSLQDDGLGSAHLPDTNGTGLSAQSGFNSGHRHYESVMEGITTHIHLHLS
ncbi:hypothetical protein BD310DRAFT_828311 [Dichomitus squalens]|uniref:Uncharacterized protein n=1 Tax=Dichomitus squalens TaxID=114155 RepID=A0A4V2K713_9APHY|nr:hypothetical protein BD310DRAFT_828311 [Dichomitus squalens]